VTGEENEFTALVSQWVTLMAKAFTTYKLLKGKEPLLRRMVCEVRYEDGHLYLDHCGRLLKRLVQGVPEWVVSPDPTPQGTSLFHLVEGLQLAFSLRAASLDLNRRDGEEVIDPDERERFTRRTEEILGLVLDELEATQFTRLGYREWYYFSFENKSEMEQWLHDLGVFSVSRPLVDAFQAKQEALGFSLVMEGQDCHYRIALNGFERSAQVPIGETTLTIRSSAVSSKQKKVLLEALKKERHRQINAAFSAVLDIDTYRLEPPEVELGEFVRECTTTNLDRFRSALPKENGKKGK
jgi:hypothetical protein